MSRNERSRYPIRVDGPRTLEIEEPVSALNVRVYGGTVNVVGTSDGSPARLEVGELRGTPLNVSCEDGTLTVAYEDLPWKGFLAFLDRKSWKRSAVVSVTVPAATRVEVGVVGASAVVSGIAGRTDIRGVTGDSTLVGLTGEVRADTVSGKVEAQAVTGDLRFHSVSGDLTVIDGAGGSVHADSVSGDMVLDLDPAAKGTDIQLTSVSGEMAIRLPDPADATVEANTTSGKISNAFDTLRVGGQWGAKNITGTLGAGTGTLKATTVSGGLALLRRPSFEAPRTDAAEGPGPHGTHGPHDAPGPRGDAPAGRPAEKKVL
ncbi:DUF4097 family beta strand repeat-containing protein [Streptomyces pinistramenti]|uniref:DUF4097 family beta strand repeat-containing protein n=1 Tax=Streptomyces pinistramenti TaxID=2884812 RepID=UPI001D0962E0|nr:DUF4097 family beta strand repeat-containing protein [Streptomyces pinistramenti]MCB5908712.1 DUF4097 domain-containing protein [Streptomyces pinistramenti]